MTFYRQFLLVFNDGSIENLKDNGDGCHVSKCFIGCVVYADDLMLLSPSIIGLQMMLDICLTYGTAHNILFNSSETVGVAIGVAL
jgi:hypothetical protein